MKYLLLLAIMVFPFASSAATFHYVNEQGVTASIEAPDAQTALALAPDIKHDSGVSLDQGYIEPGNSILAPVINAFGYSRDVVSNAVSGAVFHFVNAFGVTDTVVATDATSALISAPNIADNSGVALDQGYIDPGTPVLSVE